MCIVTEKLKQKLGTRWYLEGTVKFVRYNTTEGTFQNKSPYQLQTYDKIFMSKMAISEIFLKKKKGKESGRREADM